ncbi:MAG: hypothetical protein V1797_09075 [Pseudomonadota bacterium]
MDPLEQFVACLDPVLIAPYRWPADPIWGWWLGTLVLALWCALLGELTAGVIYRVNHRYLREHNQNMLARNREARDALRAGDRQGYKALNKKANDAFGRAFFLQMAMGSASLWPAFLAVAWLQARFEGLSLSPFGLGLGVNYLVGFLLCYLAVRLGLMRIKKYIPFLRRTKAMAEELLSLQVNQSKPAKQYGPSQPSDDAETGKT